MIFGVFELQNCEWKSNVSLRRIAFRQRQYQGIAEFL
jgi:hypothetical protein